MATCSERHSRIPAQLPTCTSTIHFNHCSTVTVNLEPTHPTNCGHIPATLPDDADSFKFESEAVAAPLFSTQVDPFYWIWRRGPILKASTIGSPARRYQLIHKNLINAIIIAHNSMALPSSRCTSTLDMGPPSSFATVMVLPVRFFP